MEQELNAMILYATLQMYAIFY